MEPPAGLSVRVTLARFRTVAERQMVAVAALCEEHASSDGEMAAAAGGPK